MRFYGVEKSSVFVLLRPSVSVEAERDSVIQCVAESPCGAALAKVVQCVCVALSIGAVYVNVKAKEDSAVARSPVAINHRDKGGGGGQRPIGHRVQHQLPRREALTLGQRHNILSPLCHVPASPMPGGERVKGREGDGEREREKERELSVQLGYIMQRSLPKTAGCPQARSLEVCQYG